MLITARANHGPADDRAVVGHATSPDLRDWTPQPPLSQPGQGFGAMEVQQYEHVDGQGRPALLRLHHRRLPRPPRRWHHRRCLGRPRRRTTRTLRDRRRRTDHRRQPIRRPPDPRQNHRPVAAAHLRQQRQTRGNFIGEITDPEPFHLPAASGEGRRAAARTRPATRTDPTRLTPGPLPRHLGPEALAGELYSAEPLLLTRHPAPGAPCLKPFDQSIGQLWHLRGHRWPMWRRGPAYR